MTRVKLIKELFFNIQLELKILELSNMNLTAISNK